MDQKRLMAIARSVPGIHLDLAGSNASTQIMTNLLTSKQISSIEEWEMKKAMKQMTAQTANRFPSQFVRLEPSYPGMINIRSFANRGTPSSTTSTVVIGPTATMKTTSQGSLGNRLGKWLGNAFGGIDSSEEKEDDPNSEKGNQDTQEDSSSPIAKGETETKRNENDHGVDSQAEPDPQASP